MMRDALTTGGSSVSTATETATLEVRGLRAGYGTFEVLHGCDLVVPAGQIVALLGHNGAGKSTLLKAIFGAVPVGSGTVVFGGEDTTRARPFEKATRGMRLVPQDGNTFPTLTIQENLRLGGLVHLADRRDGARRLADQRDAIYQLFPILLERRLAKARVLSGGERQMLAIGIALMTSPRLILLDEPSAGLAPIMVQRLFGTVQRINRELGTAVLLVEQNVNEALRLAPTVYVMQEGRVVYQGPSADRERVIRHLWGLSHTIPPHEIQGEQPPADGGPP
jgi:branched-chain amino acid transport system ATP-binding protein